MLGQAAQGLPAAPAQGLVPAALGDLFRRAARGDAGAFHSAVLNLGGSPEDAALMLSRNIRGASGRALSKTARGQNYTIELERLGNDLRGNVVYQKALPLGPPGQLGLPPGPSAPLALPPGPTPAGLLPPGPAGLLPPGPPPPVTPSETAQFMSTLKERFVNPAPPVSDIEAARLLGRENLRRQLIASIAQEQGEEAATAAAQSLPKVFGAIDDQTTALIEETLADLNPNAIARFAAHLSGLRCFR